MGTKKIEDDMSKPAAQWGVGGMESLFSAKHTRKKN